MVEASGDAAPPPLEALEAFLRNVDPGYVQYAPAFRAGGFSKPAELPFVEERHYEGSEVPMGALRRIKATATAGMHVGTASAHEVAGASAFIKSTWIDDFVNQPDGAASSSASQQRFNQRLRARTAQLRARLAKQRAAEAQQARGPVWGAVFKFVERFWRWQVRLWWWPYELHGIWHASH